MCKPCHPLADSRDTNHDLLNYLLMILVNINNAR